MATKHMVGNKKMVTCMCCRRKQPLSRANFIPNRELATNTVAWKSYFSGVKHSGNLLPNCVRTLWLHIIFFQLSSVNAVLCDDCAADYRFDRKRSKMLLKQWLKTGEVKAQPIFGLIRMTEESLNMYDVDLAGAEDVFYAALEALGHIDEELEERIVLEMNICDWRQFAHQIKK